jgi:hypothetical protein
LVKGAAQVTISVEDLEDALGLAGELLDQEADFESH